MGWFRQKPQYIRLCEDMPALQEAREKNQSQPGMHLKVMPMYGESGQTASPEKMLRVLNALEGACSFEIWVERGMITYYFWVSDESESKLVKSQITAHCPNAQIEGCIGNAVPRFKPEDYICAGRLSMVCKHYYPFETKFTTDPMIPLLNVLSYAKTCDTIVLQVLMKPADPGWSSAGYDQIYKLTNEHSEGWIDPHVVKPTDSSRAQAEILRQKVGKLAFQTEINILVSATDAGSAAAKVREIAAVFRQFDYHQGNKFAFSDVKTKKIPAFYVKMQNRQLSPTPWFFGRNMYAMTTEELANIVHLPGKDIELQDIEWAHVRQRKAPVVVNREQKMNSVVVCRNTYRDRIQDVVLGDDDLNTHLAVFGKTGTGKSTLIASMALEKINAGEGVVVIDPHGDLIRVIVPRIDQGRLDDICYIEPMNYPLRLNAIEIPNRKELSEKEIGKMKDIVISDVVSILKNIFYKDKPEYWGPRLDHIFSNIASGLLEKEGTTLVDMYFILTDEKARRKFTGGVSDPMVRNFLENELPKRKFEDLDTTVTKVSKFAVNDILRRNLCQRYGTFDIKEALDNKKVLLFDLSKGNLGENNSRILGSAIVTQVWMNVLQRAKVSESNRVRTYMYVDEFQNFSSDSFNSILSESRKYKLSLTLATQYTEQVSDEMWKGIEANVQTFASFTLGATDAQKMSRIYTDVRPEEFIQLEKYNVIVRKGQVTTQGKTKPLGREKEKLNIDYLEVIADERGGKDDSLVSEYIEKGDSLRHILGSLNNLKQTRNRDMYSSFEISKELEGRGIRIEPAILNGSLIELSTKEWVKSIWNGTVFEHGITEEGVEAIKDLMGTAATAGGDAHRENILIMSEFITRNNGVANIVKQGGAEKLPDLEIIGGEFLDKYFNGRMVNVEVEDKTMTKPARILENQAKAVNDDRGCSFAVKSEDDARKIAELINTPFSVNEDGALIYYNKESGCPFVPANEYKRPISKKDWRIFVIYSKDRVEEYIPPEDKSKPSKDGDESTTWTIEKYLRENKGPHKPTKIAGIFGTTNKSAASLMKRLFDLGRLVKYGTGLFEHKRWPANNLDA